ncbi:hypothetical protein F511_32772 [Dorcoceras hygrometricum]|uniref:Uncharacterized protein n=1 Tax=Dorcoceras hygrometricum TaxID=472368 RepID=A0A2Z7CAQ3_9LAMI|nr:hypothetical protein F511_32772 [Dorcoceras hygrometricum]
MRYNTSGSCTLNRAPETDLLSADIADVIVPLALQLVLIVPAGLTYLSSWFIFSLAIITAAGQICPPPDYEQLTQLWTYSLLIQLPSK